MDPTGNKTKCLSSVNHSAKTIHHHHHQVLYRIVFLEISRKPQKYICDGGHFVKASLVEGFNNGYFLGGFLKIYRRPTIEHLRLLVDSKNKTCKLINFDPQTSSFFVCIGQHIGRQKKVRIGSWIEVVGTVLCSIILAMSPIFCYVFSYSGSLRKFEAAPFSDVTRGLKMYRPPFGYLFYIKESLFRLKMR